MQKIQDVITQAENELEAIKQQATGRIVSRRRPKKIETKAKCTIFIDECGQHTVQSKDSFAAFVLASVIIPDDAYQNLDESWRSWKSTYLGDENKRTHEPDIRHRSRSFWCGGNRAKQEEAINALTQWLDVNHFDAATCIINRPQYVSEFGAGALDDSLPNHAYLMAVHFLAERLAMILYDHFGGATGRLVVESRGPLEDANFQYAFTRLFLDGTSYISATMFRHQFQPGIDFFTKEENNTGLQIADLVARPCGEKVIDPTSTPARWPQMRTKLCRGQETGHSILGMKIIPWEDRYEGIWES